MCTKEKKQKREKIQSKISYCVRCKILSPVENLNICGKNEKPKRKRKKKQKKTDSKIDLFLSKFNEQIWQKLIWFGMKIGRGDIFRLYVRMCKTPKIKLIKIQTLYLNDELHETDRYNTTTTTTANISVEMER